MNVHGFFYVLTRVLGLPLFFSAFFLCSFQSFSQEIIFTEEEKKWIADHPVIKLGCDPNWVPFEMEEDGEHKGIIADYIKILEQEIGITIQPVFGDSWNETMQGLKSGDIDFTANISYSEERAEYLNFTEPYLSSPLVIIADYKKGFVDGLEALRGKKIALPKGFFVAEAIKKDHPEITIEYKDDVNDCLEAVYEDEVDAFIGNLVVASYYIENEKYFRLKVAAPVEYEKLNLRLGARKDWPELISITQKVFDNISHPKRGAIMKKWVSVRYEYGINIAKIKKNAVYIAIFIALLLALILLCSKSLKKEIKKRRGVEKELVSTLDNANRKNKERKVLLQEIHHRVKNNLQIIISLLRLQQDDESDHLEKKLNETITRINTISLVHEKVYLSENLSSINFEDYITTLAKEIITSFLLENPPTLKVSSNIGEVDVKPLIPLALIVNELITNSLKYGVKGKKDGLIDISIEIKGDNIEAVYRDNGVWKESKKETGFGHTLIEVFTEQLDGTFTRNIDDGTKYTFLFEKIGYFFNDK